MDKEARLAKVKEICGRKDLKLAEAVDLGIDYGIEIYGIQLASIKSWVKTYELLFRKNDGTQEAELHLSGEATYHYLKRLKAISEEG